MSNKALTPRSKVMIKQTREKDFEILRKKDFLHFQFSTFNFQLSIFN